MVVAEGRWENVPFSSVAQLCPILRPHGLQHTKLPCPSPTPRTCSNSCPSSRWCHPTISSSVVPFTSCPQSFPASGSFQWITFSLWPKYWSFNFNTSHSTEHPGLISFRMDWLDLLAVQGALKKFSPTPQFKSINSSALSFLYAPTHIHTRLLEKP